MKQAIVDRFLDNLDTLSKSCFRSLNLSAAGIELDDLRSIVVLHALKLLDRFDPRRSVPFGGFIGSHLRQHIASELGRQTGQSSRVMHVTRLIRENAALKTSEEVMTFCKCAKETAIAALGFARAGVRAELSTTAKDEDEGTIDLADPRVLHPEMVAEQNELFEKVLREASRIEARIIDLHYRQSLPLGEIARKLEMREREVSGILTGFLSRMRRTFNEED
jgi:RNA polymerase sigma factor (sigma-70 family)